MQATCTINGCGRTDHVRRGMCDMHYSRWRRHGDPETVLKPYGHPVSAPLYDVNPDTGCWEWSGHTDALGYANYRGTSAHRAFYIEAYGDPGDLVVDHLCNNPPCVNPDHMEAVTQRENVLRGYRRKRAENPDKHEPVDGVSHGEQSGYYAGCRCEPCTAANTDRIRKARADRHERMRRDPSVAPHGTASTYQNWGCRCADCTAAKRQQFKQYVAERTAS